MAVSLVAETPGASEPAGWTAAPGSAEDTEEERAVTEAPRTSRGRSSGVRGRRRSAPTGRSAACFRWRTLPGQAQGVITAAAPAVRGGQATPCAAPARAR